MKIYCLKERKYTNDKGPIKLEKMKNGVIRAKVRCASCGKEKSRTLNKAQIAKIKEMNGGFIPAVLAGLSLGGLLG